MADDADMPVVADLEGTPEAAKEPRVEQGEQARALGLTAADCPYGHYGESRIKWFEGFGEADPKLAN